MFNKRQADTMAESNKTKKSKQDDDPKSSWPMDISKLSSIPVCDLDIYITRPHSNVGICLQSELKLAEACYCTSVLLTYHRCQIRMQLAQSKHMAVLMAYLRQNMSSRSTLKRNNMFRCATRLLPMATLDIIKDRPEMRDAILYRVAFLVSYDAYLSASPGEAESRYLELATIDGQQKDVSTFVEMLTAASERHLAKDSDRSSLWETEIQIAHCSSPPAKSRPDGISGEQRSPSIHSVDHIRETAKQYIKTLEFLRANCTTVDWKDIQSIDVDLKQRLTRMQIARRIPLLNGRSPPTPAGMLLHGVGGVGKTEIVMSWCQYIGATLILIDGSIQSSLVGHTEKTIKYLFEQAVELAKSAPVVLFFDEADQLLGTTVAESHSGLHGAIKDYFSTVLKSKSDIHVVAATNHPRRINMRDWNRRLEVKIHVQPPSEKARAQILRSVLAGYNHSLGSDDIDSLAISLLGYTAHDILSIIHVAWSDSPQLDNIKWLEATIDGRQMLLPAEDKPATMICSLEDMRKEDSNRVWLCLSLEMISKVLNSGRRGKEWPRTYSVEELEEHQRWNDQVSTM